MHYLLKGRDIVQTLLDDRDKILSQKLVLPALCQNVSGTAELVPPGYFK